MNTPSPKLKTLAASAMQHTAEYERSQYQVVVDDDVTLDDLLRPAFWAHHVSKVKFGSLIDVINATATLDVTLRVLSVGIGFVKTRVLRAYEDEAAAAERQAGRMQVDDGENAPLPDEYKITSAGKGFTVTYVPTDAKIATGKKTRADAVAAAREHANQAGIAWPEPAAAAA